MQLNITIEITDKGKYFVARCPELDFVSQGKTPEEAKKNLSEVIAIQFEEMTDAGTIGEYLAECGFTKKESHFVPPYRKAETMLFEVA
jgi:predicted RNase H-like HicB family nuclease